MISIIDRFPYYATRRSLDSAIAIIESADALLGRNASVTDSHKVFKPMLVPALICTIACIAAAVCLALFIHPAAGTAAAVVSAYIGIRIRNKRLHLQRIIVYDRAVERHVYISQVLSGEMKGTLKERYEKALGNDDPETRKAELEKADSRLNEIIELLVHDIVR